MKPDMAVYPITITMTSKTHSDALEKLKKTIDFVRKDIENLGVDVFSSKLSDFYKKDGYRKKVQALKFFGVKDNKTQASLVLNLYVSFAQKNNFWTRASYIAKANDFIISLQNKFKGNENILIGTHKHHYRISNIEQYRKAIINSIYSKAQAMANIIADFEGVKLKIDKVKFGQKIQKSIIDFNNAKLTIQSEINFKFITPPPQPK